MNGQSANNDVYMHFKAEIIQCEFRNGCEV